MEIGINEVNHIAHLARLQLSPQEKVEFAKQLGSVLDYIEKLGDLNTEEITPTSHAIPMRNVLRSDGMADSLGRESLLKNGPDTRKDHFSIPKVIQ